MAITKKPKEEDNNVFAGNLDLGFTNKKKFTVGGDPNKVIEFDPSDIGVANRLAKSLPRMQELADKWEKLNTSAESIKAGDDDEAVLSATKEFSDNYEELETSMRDIIDDVFDAKVADTLLGNTSAFSPVNGKFKYEHVIEAMLKCYEQQIQDEAPKFRARNMGKYSGKYLKK